MARTFTDSQVLSFMTQMILHGGEVLTAPHDFLNPGMGVYARLRVPADNALGYIEFLGQHGGWDRSTDRMVTPSVTEALRDLVAKAQPSLAPEMVPMGPCEIDEDGRLMV